MFLDIGNPTNKIYIEYDGGFHRGNVIMGNMTEKEFDKKEMKRSCQLSDWGWKEIRIISLTDLLPEDNKIVEIMKYAKEYLDLGHHYIKFDIDGSCVINSSGKFYYNYGKLQRINI